VRQRFGESPGEFKFMIIFTEIVLLIFLCGYRSNLKSGALL